MQVNPSTLFFFIISQSNNGLCISSSDAMATVRPFLKAITCSPTDTSKVTLNESFNTSVTNEKCNKSSITKRFSLKIHEGKILVNNIDTMENFVIDKINDPINIITLSYSNNCDKNRYVIVNREGLVFFTNNQINTISDVKKMEEEFYLLNTDLRFESIILGTENGKIDLYGKTASNNLYKIDLR